MPETYLDFTERYKKIIKDLKEKEKSIFAAIAVLKKDELLYQSQAVMFFMVTKAPMITSGYPLEYHDEIDKLCLLRRKIEILESMIEKCDEKTFVRLERQTKIEIYNLEHPQDSFCIIC
jgi:hypothetical protein